MSGRTEISLTRAIDLWKTGQKVDWEDSADGHVLTVEHLGSEPESTVLGDYYELLEKILDHPPQFDDFTVDIRSNRTIVTRNDVPVNAFGTKQDMEVEAESPLRPYEERKVFEAAAEHMGSTIADLADMVDEDESFVRATLADEGEEEVVQ